MQDIIFQWISLYGYAALFFLLMIGIFGIPIPDEILLTFTGYLVFKGQMELVLALLTAFFGSCCGITLSYIVGRTGGWYLTKKFGRYFHITPQRIEKVRQWLNHTGRWGITFGYFIPGVRHLTALVAGATRLEYYTFAVFAYSGALLWSTSFIAAGYVFGREWTQMTGKAHELALASAGVGIGLLAGYYLLRRFQRH